MGMLSFTTLVLFPSLLHDLRGYPDSVIGTLIAARGLGNWLAFLFIVKLTRIAPRFAIAAGLSIQAFSGFWMAQLDINMTEADVFWTNLLQGLGQSVTFTPMTVMAFATLPSHQVTEGSAVFTMMRNFGSSLFISLSVMLLVRSTNINYSRMTEFITPYRHVLSNLPAAWDLETTAGLLRMSNEIQRQAAMIGYVNAFYLLAFTAAAAIPLAILMRSVARER
jgi:DHA2 family multidrug resistance protein